MLVLMGFVFRLGVCQRVTRSQTELATERYVQTGLCRPRRVHDSVRRDLQSDGVKSDGARFLLLD